MSLIQGVGEESGDKSRVRPKRRSARVTGGTNGPVMAALKSLARETAADLEPPFRMPRLREPKFPSREVDIRDHGAVGDGKIDCTTAIADAIATCARAGGGRVLVPAGEWFTGPIHLKSNINLHFEEGATLRFSSDPGQYLPPVFVRWSGQECYNYSPLIYARDCQNIAITGPGRLLGQGKAWWSWQKQEHQTANKLYQMVLKGVAVRERIFGCEGMPLRPQLILPLNCTNVLLEDFVIAESPPFWSIHLAYCQNVIVRRLRINAVDGPNNDGIIIDSSRNVIVEDCELRTHDDCIALKSGLNEDGRRVGKPTENVIIRRVHAGAGHGGITIGSDMSGGVRNVFVHDCHCDGLDNGIRFKAARGRGGTVEQIHVQNITMGRIPGEAIQLTTEYPSFALPNGSPPVFRDITIRNVTCQHAGTAVRMSGLPDSALKNIQLEDLTITAGEGLHCSIAKNIQLINLRISPEHGPILSIRDSNEVLIHGLHNTDGASVFLELRGRQTQNVRLRGEANDTVRPAVVLGVDVPKDALVHE